MGKFSLTILDHVFFFQIDGVKSKRKYLFKFSNMWLQDTNFCSMVKNNWPSINVLEEVIPMDRLVIKLKCLKKILVKWEKEKKANEELYKIEKLMEIF